MPRPKRKKKSKIQQSVYSTTLVYDDLNANDLVLTAVGFTSPHPPIARNVIFEPLFWLTSVVISLNIVTIKWNKQKQKCKAEAKDQQMLIQTIICKQGIKATNQSQQNKMKYSARNSTSWMKLISLYFPLHY